jgi:hypothetical protein
MTPSADESHKKRRDNCGARHKEYIVHKERIPNQNTGYQCDQPNQCST